MILFRSTRPSEALLRALQVAVAAHRPTQLRELLARHGDRRFAAALAQGTARQIDDALSMLPIAARAGVFRRLPRAVRLRQQHLARSLEMGGRPAPAPRGPLHGLLVPWRP